MGLNFYANQESIGVAIFRNGIMYSITDSSLTSFFTVDLGEDIEVSLVSVVQVSEDVIYVAAVANVDPSKDKLLFASKTISYEGLLLSCPTMIEHFSLSNSEKEIHKNLFDLDGSLLTGNDDVHYVSYETYTGSHGFGDFNLVEMEALGATGIKDATKKIFKIVSADISNIDNNINIPTDESISAIESFCVNGGIFIFAQGDTILHEFNLSSGTAIGTNYTFENNHIQDEFTNIHFSSIQYVTEKGLEKNTKYNPVYAPAGVFKKYNSLSFIVINRLEMLKDSSGTPKESIAVYMLLPGSDGKKEVIYDNVKASSGNLVASDGAKFDVPKVSEMSYIFYSNAFQINTSLNFKGVAGRNRGVIHELLDASTYSGQKEAIITVKSLCNFMDYGSPIISS